MEPARTEETIQECLITRFFLIKIIQASADASQLLVESSGKVLTARHRFRCLFAWGQDNFFRLFIILLDNPVKYCAQAARSAPLYTFGDSAFAFWCQISARDWVRRCCPAIFTGSTELILPRPGKPADMGLGCLP